VRNRQDEDLGKVEDFFTVDSPRHAFILDVPKERLKEAPGFDKDHWPDVVDAEARTRIFGFYGVTPDWD
jgi:hypothetical protein